MKVIVCGGRDYRDQDHVWTFLTALHRQSPISAILQGGAFGADTWAMTWGVSEGVTVIEYPADWKRLGRSAGPIRNRQMLSDGKPDIVVAFPGGRGTANMVSLATEAGIRVIDAARNEKSPSTRLSAGYRGGKLSAPRGR